MADGPPAHPELAEEQAYIDAAYARLDAMREAAARVAAGFSEVGAGGTHQARLERDVADSVTRRRLAALDIGQAPLVFGRIDRTQQFAPADRRFYIGRLAVNDEQQDPLVVDWRAPVAEPFYRATGVAPMDVVRRRHFLTRPNAGRELVGIDDEVFDRDAADAAGLSAVGEAALLAALDRARTGRMGDIVATIQAEQDEAIRADVAGPLIVSGGPGTGKTAVALHRAAYLLYTYRKRLASQGVLLVGPSPIFLRYIDQVLPSLGEDEVTLSTAAGLKPQFRVTAVDEPEVAIVKGDARMARVIAARVARPRAPAAARCRVRVRRHRPAHHAPRVAPPDRALLASAGHTQRAAAPSRALAPRPAAGAVPPRLGCRRARRRRLGPRAGQSPPARP